jgi:SAM-dependent methyltransferase
MISDMIKLREPPPPGRSVAQIVRHFEVERAIANRLRLADRGERARMYATMYDELFALVPDHPRLARRGDPARLDRLNAQKLALLRPYLSAGNTIVEFGCGDASFAYLLCGHAARVYGVDICEQRDPAAPAPANFQMIVYDGFDLPLPAACADVTVSDQLIEHLHPDDVRMHLASVRRILKPGGVYVLRTPHRFSGPHDVSRYVSDEARGFHLKEWTFGELRGELIDAGFAGVHVASTSAVRRWVLSVAVLQVVETVMNRIPRRLRRPLARKALNEICVVASTARS